MEAGDWIAIVALCLSSVSFVLAFRLERLTTKANLRPVLVFVYDDDTGWRVRNVGKGPALNVLLAKKDDAMGWYDPMRVPPLPENGDFGLAWWGQLDQSDKPDAPEIGSVYEDLQGEVYSSTCRDDLSRTSRGRLLPDWSEDVIERHWRRSDESSRDGVHS